MPSISLRYALVLLCLMSLAGTSGAQPIPATGANADRAYDQATDLMDRGHQLMNAGRFADALVAFDEAYDRLPSPNLFVSMGTAQRNLGRRADAANSYQRFLNSKDRDLSLEAGVKVELRTLDRQLGRIEVAIDIPGAEVQLRAGDGAWLPAMAWLRVEPGAFTLRARVLGSGQEQSTSGTVEVGAATRASFAFTTFATPVDDRAATASSPVPRSRRHRRLVFGLGATAAALTVSGALLVVSARRAKDRAHELCPDPQQCPGTALWAEEQYSRAVLHSRLAVGAFVSAAAVTAVAGYVWWRDRPTGGRLGLVATHRGAAVVYGGSF